MEERIFMIVVFGLAVGVIWWAAMHLTPGKGIHRFLERTVQGMLICFMCYLFLAPFGFQLPQTPVAALMGGYLGLPGIALSTFLSLWP